MRWAEIHGDAVSARNSTAGHPTRVDGAACEASGGGCEGDGPFRVVERVASEPPDVDVVERARRVRELQDEIAAARGGGPREAPAFAPVLLTMNRFAL